MGLLLPKWYDSWQLWVWTTILCFDLTPALGEFMPTAVNLFQKHMTEEDLDHREWA